MDRALLGSRIKEARLAKKLTQTEVVGSFITRNMLSQIESGTATPSIKTLAYLAEVLDLPMEQLIGAEEPGGDLALLQEAKQRLREGALDEALEKAAALPDTLADERAALLAQASLRRGEALAQEGQLPQAAELIHKAAELADVGIYANPNLKARALLLMGQLAEGLVGYSRKMAGK